MRVRTLPLLLACLAFTPSGQCLAANPSQSSSASVRESSPIHVLGFVAGDHFDQAETLTRALKNTIERSTNQKLGSGEFSLEVLTAALGCPEKPDQACLKKIASKISSQRFLWGTFEISGQRVDAELHLHADEESDKKVKFSYRGTLTDATDTELLGIAANAAAQLVGPIHYRVVVQSTERTGIVLVDGKEAGTLDGGEATIDVAGGDHLFRLKPAGERSGSEKSAGDRVLAEQKAKVQVAEQTRVRLDPGEEKAAAKGEPAAEDREPKPDIQPKEQEPPTTKQATDEPRTSNAQRTWGYITLAAGGVMLAGGAAAAADLYLLNHKDNFERYRDGLSPSEDACTEAKHGRVVPGAMTPSGVDDLCRNASMLEIGQIALFAGGVVAIGTGVTLLLTSKSEPSKSASLFEPRVVVGKNRADFGFALRF